MEKFFYRGKILAIKIKKWSNGSRPITEDSNALQALSIKYQSGHLTKPHLHSPKKRVTRQLQEALVVINGKIRVNLYGSGKKILKYFFLKNGEAAIILSGGHAVYFLKNTKMLEFKNGPFLNDKKAVGD